MKFKNNIKNLNPYHNYLILPFFLSNLFIYSKYFLFHIIILGSLLILPINIFFKIMLILFISLIFVLILDNKYMIKLITLILSVVLLNLLILIVYFSMNLDFSILYQYFFIKSESFIFFNKGINIFYSLDYLSLIFLILTSFLFIIVYLILYNYNELNIKLYFSLLILLEFFLINTFINFNLFWFFFFFESIIFPMFLIILIGGSRYQKIKAGYYFFFFTIFGSLFLFISINYLMVQYNTVNLYKLSYYIKELTLYEQNLLWLSFFLSFAIKIPMFPFHTWLPEAHVEAPTIGSILLAGILLKLGCYGLIRINLTLLPLANIYFSSFIYIICIISIFYSCFIACRQSDFKRIIAYASIAHMNLIVLGIFSFNILGLYGAIFQSVSHGLVASGLFFLVGILYTRYKSRIIQYYSGLTQVMPIFSSYFLFFTFANISFPLTSNFIGEFLLFIGISSNSLILVFISLFSIILNSLYSLWFCNRLIYGNLKSQLIYFYKDLFVLENFILLLIVILIISFGIYPNLMNIGNLIFFIKSLLTLYV